MKLLSLIFILYLFSACSGEGTMYLYDGTGAYGQGLKDTDYSSLLFLGSFVTSNNTTALSPAFLSAAALRPEFRLSKYQNGSGYFHPILPLWDQFTFFLPFISMQDWFSGSYDRIVPSSNNFLKEDWEPSAPDHVTPTMRQFMQEDGYLEGVEQHNDPDRMELNHFLDDDEPPGRPLL
jgi:hypothetical protein